VNWISVYKQAPEDGAIVLAWSVSSDDCVIASFDFEEGFSLECEGTAGGTTIGVSHWMPLPERPTLDELRNPLERKRQ
jgi:hypothetical protein